MLPSPASEDRAAIDREFAAQNDFDFPPITSSSSYEQQDECIAAAIRSLAVQASRRIEILEAGCGIRWPIDLHDVDYRLTGADLDPHALKLRLALQKDLDEAIEGDLCTMTLPAGAFDVVYSAYVLEHIRDANLALNNMLSALRPGALLVLRIPDFGTARALITRHTPFWFHVFYHRRVMKVPMAGTPGHAPYPTYYHPVISQTGLRAYARQSRLRCLSIYSDDFARDGKGLSGVLFRAGSRIIDLLSFGRYTSRYSDLIYIFEKL
jgi:SAM-dependent methyltransferase